MNQLKITYSRSLNPSIEDIKLNAIEAECQRTGYDPDTVVKFHTNLDSATEYMERRFNIIGYLQYRHEVSNYKNPTVNFWSL